MEIPQVYHDSFCWCSEGSLFFLGEKLCRRCGEVLPLDHFYPTNQWRKRTQDYGRRPYCKECCKNENRKYNTENSEAVKAARQEYYQKNRERFIEKHREWTARNREHYNEYVSQYYRNRKINDPGFSERLKEKCRVKNRQAYHSDSARRSKMLMNSKRHRARRAGAKIHTLTSEQWLWLKDIYGHRCAYCGKQSERLTMDHIVPVSKGGNHALSNLVPACPHCNSTKNARTPDEAGMQIVVKVNPLKLLKQQELF